MVIEPIPVLGRRIIKHFHLIMLFVAFVLSVLFKNASNQMLNYKGVWYNGNVNIVEDKVLPLLP